MEAEDRSMTRRQFVLSLLRILALGSVGGVALRLLTGRRPPPGETCVNQGVCRGCAAFSVCGLPAALSARERAPRTGGAR